MNKFIIAAANMDWQQVVMNGGPPCFHIEENGNFCGRAYRWVGHHADVNKHPELHEFVSLVDLVRAAGKASDTV